MSVNPFAVAGIIVSVLALLAFLFVNFDRIITRYLSWRYTPDVDLGISLGKENFVESDSIPCTELQPYDDELMFGVAIANSGEVDVEVDLTVAVSSIIKSTGDYFDAPDKFDTGYTVEMVHHGFGRTPPKQYKFDTFSLPSKSYGRKINLILELNPEEVKVFRSSRVELSARFRAEASQFSIPLLNRDLPENIVEFGAVQRDYEILGPHHDEVDMSDLEESDKDVKKITIDGPIIERGDGSKVCIGYYEDDQGRVIDRFSVPPGEYKVPKAVENIEYLNSMAELSNHPINEEYKSELPESPWEE